MNCPIDVIKIRKNLGLKRYEMSGLLGNSNPSQIQLEKNYTHNNVTVMFYKLIQIQDKFAINSLLDLWLLSGPKNKIHGRQLMRIAERFKSREDYIDWVDRFKSRHPDGF